VGFVQTVQVLNSLMVLVAIATEWPKTWLAKALLHLRSASELALTALAPDAQAGVVPTVQVMNSLMVLVANAARHGTASLQVPVYHPGDNPGAKR
jgi:hypothetical protein